MAIGETVILGMVVIGAVLMILEALIPGANFIVVGVTVLLTGLSALAIPGVTIPILVVIFTIVGASTLYFYNNIDLYEDDVDQTSDSDDLEYSEGLVIDEVTPNRGRVKLEESTGMTDRFQARCPQGSIEEGTKIVVTDAGGGSILEVVPRDESEMDEMFDTEYSFET